MATLYADVFNSIERRRKQEAKDEATLAAPVRSAFSAGTGFLNFRTPAERAVRAAEAREKTARRGRKVRGRRPRHADGRAK